MIIAQIIVLQSWMDLYCRLVEWINLWIVKFITWIILSWEKLSFKTLVQEEWLLTEYHFDFWITASPLQQSRRTESLVSQISFFLRIPNTLRYIFRTFLNCSFLVYSLFLHLSNLFFFFSLHLSFGISICPAFTVHHLKYGHHLKLGRKILREREEPKLFHPV